VKGSCAALEPLPKISNLYASSDIVRVMKSRRIRWVGHPAPMGEMRNLYRILVRKPEGKTSPRRPRDGRIMLG
jgi:hypothetical protein